MKNTIYQLLVVVLCMAATITVKAQVQVSAGPEAGFTIAGIYTEDESTYAGFNGHLGGSARIQFGKYFAIRPSVLLKFGTLSNADYNDEKISLTRIAVPVPIMYSHIFGNGGNLFIGAGPNLMYSISGKYTTDAGGSEKISFGSNPGEWKPLDVGLHLKGGYQLSNGLAFSTFLNVGFTNLGNVSGYEEKSLDAFGFSIGYMFGGGGEDY